MATRSRQPGFYELPPGRSLGSRYEVVEFLGCGWEGEVYKVVEVRTGIERAAKIFYPQRNPRGRALLQYARKLNKLGHVPIIIQYHHQDTARVRGRVVEFMVSEYVPGELLSAFQARQPGKRLKSFEALHVFHALASGIAPIHQAGEYHGDLHTDNVVVRLRGIGFEVKLMDFFDLGRAVCAATPLPTCTSRHPRLESRRFGGARPVPRDAPEGRAAWLGHSRPIR